ncbi:Cuticlin-1 [Amphibalanus amphitrite]|uniref:Cuticlin-1 n=1 Tax=Amphibalanus amphitrite TaxID=1232801 RepID=A0A6A4XG54_AMPAM|nr:Cuticlin-1 [Amphibalanus amphitrite]
MPKQRLMMVLMYASQLVWCDEFSSAHLPAEHSGGGGPLLDGGRQLGPNYGPPPPPQQGYSGPATGDADPWLLPAPDMPKIKNIEVQCEKASMRVNVDFDRPFYGMIFSKGHYSDGNCVHMQPGSGALNAQFEIYLNSCGMAASESGSYGQPNPAGSFVENTIIIQYDPLVQEVWDQARKLRCTWYDYYEKKVTFKPFQVDMLNAVTANFLGDNLQCWMQIQVGKGPWASEVSGIVKIGQTMTMVLAIKDDENKFDMLVRNCVAHDGRRAPLQLVDGNGCVTRPKVMSKFQKIKNFGSSASVVSYAYFQAFKFPDSMNVHFQCVIQVCRYQCPEAACGGQRDYDTSPRIPAGEYQGAGSEQQPVIVDGEQANDSENRIDAALNRQGPPPANGGRRRAQQQRQQHADRPIPQPVNIGLKPGSVTLPRPPSPYPFVNRQGVASDDDSAKYAISGQPRALDDKQLDELAAEAAADGALRRRRRDTQEMTDVETERTIQVVAPGDVAFSLSSSNQDSLVVSESPDAVHKRNNICMSVPGFVAGLIMLLLVLVIAIIVSVFLFSRLRAFSGKASLFASGVDDPEFVKCPN